MVAGPLPALDRGTPRSIRAGLPRTFPDPIRAEGARKIRSSSPPPHRERASFALGRSLGRQRSGSDPGPDTLPPRSRRRYPGSWPAPNRLQPRPTNGIWVAMTVIVATFASNGRLVQDLLKLVTGHLAATHGPTGRRHEPSLRAARPRYVHAQIDCYVSRRVVCERVATLT